jgi:hypothetical protein
MGKLFSYLSRRIPRWGSRLAFLEWAWRVAAYMWPWLMSGAIALLAWLQEVALPYGVLGYAFSIVFMAILLSITVGVAAWSGGQVRSWWRGRRSSDHGVEKKIKTSGSCANKEIFSYLITHLFPQMKYVNSMVTNLSISVGFRYPEMKGIFEVLRDSSGIDHCERHLEHLHSVDGQMTEFFVLYVKSYFDSISKMEALLGIIELDMDSNKKFQNWEAAHVSTMSELRKLLAKPYMGSAYDVLKREHILFHS